MKQIALKTILNDTQCAWAFVIAGMLVLASAMAGKPAWAGGDKGNKGAQFRSGHCSPGGYRYVRVAGDILPIAIGTGLVIEALQDMGRM